MKPRGYSTALVCFVVATLLSVVVWAQDGFVQPTPEPTPTTAPTTEPSAELPFRGDPCHDDGDCYWGDGCNPTICVDARRAPPAECPATATVPGTCGCVEGQCTLMPSAPEERRSTETGCSSNADCAVDIRSGTCHLYSNTHVGPIERRGPVCLCDEATTACIFHWVEPIPCESFRDCWFETEPRVRPVRATEPREAPIEPCLNGGIDPVCAGSGEERFCAIVSWDC